MRWRETSSLDHQYDVVIAGARVAGASTALLLAKAGARVLVVDPVPMGRDTLSTHALMRGGVLQLHRLGVLDAIRAAGTPTIRATTFHYGSEAVTVPIAERDGVDGLYAPRRTVLDAALVRAARDAGAEFAFGSAVSELTSDARGRVDGVILRRRGEPATRVRSGLVIGADGLRSKVARLVGAPLHHVSEHFTSSVYGYWPGLDIAETHWYYGEGAAMGAIPTNDGDTCVFVSMPPEQFQAGRRGGLEPLHRTAVASLSPELAERMGASGASPELRAFAGAWGFLRRSAGPGWALVGDAGYFKDPLTAHGITDALRDAELLAGAVLNGTEPALHRYEAERDAIAMGMMAVTDAIASFQWTLDEVRELHLTLAREMKRGIEKTLEFDAAPVAALEPRVRRGITSPPDPRSEFAA